MTETIALYLGAAWASGLNLYATVLVLGYLEHSGHVHLPATLAIAAHPVVMLVAAALYAIEFFADKVPWVDSIWDAVHTFIRIPAGALLAFGALQPMDPVVETVALLLAGTIAAGSHGVKMSTRLALNLSPEPFTNWIASIFEDILVVGGLVLMAFQPILFFLLLAALAAAVVYFLPRLFRAFRSGVAYARAKFTPG